jgi:hypothetical protein
MKYLFLLFIIPLSISAQQATDLLVSGKITDATTKSPLPFATVTLLDSDTNKAIVTVLTSEDGSFEASAKPGNYYLKVQYVGYEDKTLKSELLSPLSKNASLGVISLSSGSISLNEVEVRAEKSRMEFDLDKRIFNVGRDLANAGNTAADILDMVPSVNVDPEGNLSLRGSGGVRILIDGKPSGLLSAGDTKALLRMQGDIIESIEVITNPSARYEAEGEAGIINIILKKNQKKGFNGSFGLNTGVPHNHAASYNLNYRQKDFNFFSNFGMDYRRSPGGGFSTQDFFEGGTLIESYSVDNASNRGGLSGYVQFGTDWNINAFNTVTGSVLLKRGRDKNFSDIIYTDFDGISNIQTFRDVIERENENNIEGSIDYKKTFLTPKKELNFTFKYILDNDLEEADYEQFVGTRDELSLLQNSSNTENEANMLFQADFVQPFGEDSKFETGLRAALRTIDNDFLVQEEQDGQFETLSGFDDNLAYKENIYAAYAIVGHKVNKFSMQAGLRAELTDIEARLIKSNVNNDQYYFSLFPSSTVSYEIAKDNQVQLSYSRRLSRPYFRNLLPFSNFNDPRNNRFGNPALRPEFTNSFELGYLKYLEKGTFLSSIYYRNTTGVVEEITTASDDGTTIRTPVNLAERGAYGLEMNYTANPLEWLDITSDLNFFRALVNGEYEGRNYNSDTFSWSGRITSKFTLKNRLKAQFSYDYDAPVNTTQGRRLSVSAFDLAASKDVFSNKGTFTIACRDLFNTRIRRSIIDLPELQAESSFQWRQARSLVLSFNYRLNQDKKNTYDVGRN